MKRLLILLTIGAAGAVAACSPGASPSPSEAPVVTSAPSIEAPSLEPSAGSSEVPTMPTEPSLSPSTAP